MADKRMKLKPGTCVANRWTIVKKLGSGAFGAVYLCTDPLGEEAALKTEAVSTSRRFLRMEASIMRKLANLQETEGKKHFCRCLDLGHDEQPDKKTNVQTKFNYIVMSLVGRGLDRLVPKATGRFSPGTAIGVSIQMLEAIKALHKIGYVHRDIKPDNTAIGRTKDNEKRLLYLIDFGMAHRLITNGYHRHERSKVEFRGTLQYAPASTHMNRDYGRKDDVESWFYVLIELYRGSLPWDILKRSRQIGDAKCRRVKKDVPEQIRKQAAADLLDGCPKDFAKILKHIDGLQFYDEPDYALIISILRDHLTASGIQEHPYDWEKASAIEDQPSSSGGTTSAWDVGDRSKDKGRAKESTWELKRSIAGSESDETSPHGSATDEEYAKTY
uniref:Protein kinase domain-containing protein n=1 Tax=Globodera rostochiensis TaxID=31243 RepID=A0A914I931_GLORO